MSDQPQPSIMPLQPDGSLSFGQRLASQRKLRGLSLSDVAQQLKVAEATVEALETGVPDTTGISEQFMRGYARNYAQLIGIELSNQLSEQTPFSSVVLSSVNQLDQPMHYQPDSKINNRRLGLWLSLAILMLFIAIISQVNIAEEWNWLNWLNVEKK